MENDDPATLDFRRPGNTPAYLAGSCLGLRVVFMARKLMDPPLKFK